MALEQAIVLVWNSENENKGATQNRQRIELRISFPESKLVKCEKPTQKQN
jgi:hypothetical protein